MQNSTVLIKSVTRTGIRLCDLPNELLDRILGLALEVPFEAFDHPLPSPFDRTLAKYTPSSRILEVCTVFRDIGYRHLYETVVLRSKAQVLALIKALRGGKEGAKCKAQRAPKSLHKMVKKLRVEDAPQSPLSEVLRLCGNATHLWVNVSAGQSTDKDLESMKLVHITIWDVEVALVGGVDYRARDHLVNALCTMIRRSQMLESLKYHRPREADSVLCTQIISGILASSSLKTVTLPSRPLRSEPDRDLSLFDLFLKMKSLVQLRIEADHYTIADFYSEMPNCHVDSLKKHVVLFEPSDLDAPSYTFSFNLDQFDLARQKADEERVPRFGVLQLLIHWYTFGLESEELKDLKELNIVDRKPSLSATDLEGAPEIKADYRAFSGFLRVHLAGLKRMGWETDWDPFRDGTADTVACGLEERLSMLEFLEYKSSERHFLDTLCTMCLPRLTELRLPGDSTHQAGIELFLWVHGNKLTKLEIDLGTHIEGILAEFCPNLQELTLRVTQKEFIDLRNFGEVTRHAKLKHVRVLHEGGSQMQVRRQLSFIREVDFAPFRALKTIQLQCRWPSAPTRWNLENNFFVLLAQLCWRFWRIKVLDESETAWEPRI